MVLSCGAKVFKYCIFVFNLIFFIAGIVCLGVGIWFIADDRAGYRLATISDSSTASEIEDKPQVIRDAGILMAVGGAVIFLIAFLGCCGAIKEWRPLLVLYAVCLLLILSIELAAAVFAAINRQNIEGQIQTSLSRSLRKFYNRTDNVVKSTWDNAMRDYQCCGVSSLPFGADFNQTDWRLSGNSPGRRRLYPDACCPSPPCSESNKYSQGCYEAIKDSLQRKLGVIIGVAAVVAFIQLIGVIFAFCLCRAITDEM